jgi:hypothetical protein
MEDPAVLLWTQEFFPRRNKFHEQVCAAWHNFHFEMLAVLAEAGLDYDFLDASSGGSAFVLVDYDSVPGIDLRFNVKPGEV